MASMGHSEAAPLKKYSRHTVKTNALGAGVFAVAARDDDFADTELGDFPSPSRGDSSGGAAREVPADKAKALLEVGAGARAEQFVDSPQDVVGMMLMLSPGESAVKWPEEMVKNAAEKPTGCSVEMDISPSTGTSTGNTPSSEEISMELQGEETESEPTPSAAPPAAPDLTDEAFLVGPAGLALLRTAVQGQMSEDSMGWSINTWVASVSAALDVIVTPALKRILKVVVIEELAPMLSQTQQTQNTDAGGADIDRLDDAGDDADATAAAAGIADATAHAGGSEEQYIDGSILSASREGEISAVVVRLLNEESVQWSVKTWTVRVAAELNISHLSAGDKIALNEQIYAAAAELLTQTETQDVSDDFALLDDELLDMNAGLDMGVANTSPGGVGDGYGDDESSAVLSSEEEEEDDVSLASGEVAEKSKKHKKNKAKNKGNSNRTKADHTTTDDTAAAAAVKEKDLRQNEELVAEQALEEGMNARAQAVHDMIYRCVYIA
jgi:hypothetical protein